MMTVDSRVELMVVPMAVVRELQWAARMAGQMDPSMVAKKAVL